MRTSVDQITLDCLRRAQRGGRESRSLLAQQAKGKVYTFIYRTTLDHELSEDLTQETLMELIRALPRLQLTSENGFWSWVYRTALGKVQHHFRRQGARRMEQRTMVNSEILETMSGKPRVGPAATLWRKEMVELILAAMEALSLEYRTVLTLRCLEDQSYAQIATVLGGSQMRAKMLFYRAKTALRSQLARKGLRRSHFLGALTVFAAMTSTSTRSASAMPAVTAASAKATVSGAVLGTVLSKAVLVGIGIVLAVTSAGILLGVTGTVPILSVWNKPAPPPWTGPGQPLFDSNMRFMGMAAGYVRLSEIVASQNPDQDDWRCFEHWPLVGDVQGIAAPQDKPSNTMLVVEQDHWIEYRIPAPFRNRYGAEIGITVRNWGTLPSFYLTDGDQRLQEISVTHYRGGHAPGFMVLGFDLSTITIDFRVRGIRIVGHDREGPFGGCGITNPAVSLAARHQSN
ncbi:MAG: sigma-70 family RNA polymerase sigma factor [Phycisphaerales bacterium]|nr:MAG: sigma-70 family RNA polymerase sigma factor [Phycisphaerales bacterium]